MVLLVVLPTTSELPGSAVSRGGGRDGSLITKHYCVLLSIYLPFLFLFNPLYLRLVFLSSQYVVNCTIDLAIFIRTHFSTLVHLLPHWFYFMSYMILGLNSGLF
jgi:hypothetical protein